MALAVTCYLAFGFALRPVRVRGISMYPTLSDGSIYVVNLLSYRFKEPARGDITAVKMPGNRSYYVKRILGLPGETIAFQSGRLLINGVQHPESYLASKGGWNLEPIIIPEGQYFIAGDNRETEFSHHTLGFIRKSQLAGMILPQ